MALRICSINELPRKHLFQILSWLDLGKDLRAALLTCRLWNMLLDSETSWRLLCERTFGCPTICSDHNDNRIYNQSLPDYVCPCYQKRVHGCWDNASKSWKEHAKGWYHFLNTDCLLDDTLSRKICITGHVRLASLIPISLLESSIDTARHFGHDRMVRVLIGRLLAAEGWRMCQLHAAKEYYASKPVSFDSGIRGPLGFYSSELQDRADIFNSYYKAKATVDTYVAEEYDAANTASILRVLASAGADFSTFYVELVKCMNNGSLDTALTLLQLAPSLSWCRSRYKFKPQKVLYPLSRHLRKWCKSILAATVEDGLPRYYTVADRQICRLLVMQLVEPAWLTCLGRPLLLTMRSVCLPAYWHDVAGEAMAVAMRYRCTAIARALRDTTEGDSVERQYMLQDCLHYVKALPEIAGLSDAVEWFLTGLTPAEDILTLANSSRAAEQGLQIILSHRISLSDFQGSSRRAFLGYPCVIRKFVKQEAVRQLREAQATGRNLGKWTEFI